MSKVKIKILKNKKGRWYWSAVSPNGRRFFACLESDGYASRAAAVKNFNTVVKIITAKKFTIV